MGERVETVWHLPYLAKWGDGGGGYTWDCSCEEPKGDDEGGPYARLTKDEASRRAVAHVIAKHEPPAGSSGRESSDG